KRKAPEASEVTAPEATETTGKPEKDAIEEYEDDSEEERRLRRGGEPAAKKAKFSDYEATYEATISLSYILDPHCMRSAVFHGGERTDYMGRSWIEPPSHL